MDVVDLSTRGNPDLGAQRNIPNFDLFVTICLVLVRNVPVPVPYIIIATGRRSIDTRRFFSVQYLTLRQYHLKL